MEAAQQRTGRFGGRILTNPRELAEERAKLQARLNGIAMWNTAGKTIDQLAEVELDKIETMRRLAEVNRQIDDYIEGRS